MKSPRVSTYDTFNPTSRLSKTRCEALILALVLSYLLLGPTMVPVVFVRPPDTKKSVRSLPPEIEMLLSQVWPVSKSSSQWS